MFCRSAVLRIDRKELENKFQDIRCNEYHNRPITLPSKTIVFIHRINRQLHRSSLIGRQLVTFLIPLTLNLATLSEPVLKE